MLFSVFGPCFLQESPTDPAETRTRTEKSTETLAKQKKAEKKEKSRKKHGRKISPGTILYYSILHSTVVECALNFTIPYKIVPVLVQESSLHSSKLSLEQRH